MKTYRSNDIFRYGIPLNVSCVDAVPRDWIKPHTHDFLELVLIAGGCALHEIYSMEEKLECSRSLLEGDVIAIPPGRIHAYRVGRKMRYYNILFGRELLTPFIADFKKTSPWEILFAEGSPDEGRKLHLPRTETATVENCLSGIIDERFHPGRGSDNYLRALFCEMLTILLRAPEATLPDGGEHIGIYDSLTLMLENPAVKLSLPELAAAARMSVSNYTRKFRAVTGESPIARLINLRLEIATERLASSDISISVLAEELGFCHENHFIAAFRRRYDVTPARYRRQWRQRHSPNLWERNC